jgi:hypothetical protein
VLAAAGAIATFSAALRALGSGVRPLYRHFRPLPDDAPPSSQESFARVEFTSIAIVRSSPYWQDYEPPPRRTTFPFDRRTSQYVHRNEWVEGSDLPFDVTIINRSDREVLLTHVGLEILSLAHLFATPFKGETPQAIKVELHDAYDVVIDRSIWSAGDIDPDEDVWLEIGESFWSRLDDPVYVEPAAPYRFILNIPDYEGRLSDHVILRLAVRSGDAIVRSHDITAFVHSFTEPP